MNFLTITRRAAAAALAAFIAATPAVSHAQSKTYDGDWEGVLQAPNGAKLRLALHVKTEGDTTTAVLDSLDQGVTIPSSAVKTDDGQIEVLFLSIMGELKGKLSADGRQIEGAWTQGGALPLTLTRASGGAK